MSSIDNMTLREKIGQTAVFRHHIIERIDDYDKYFEENPVGFTWLMSHPKEIYKKLEASMGNPELIGTKEDFFTDYINKINEHSSVPVMPVCDASQGIPAGMFEGHPTLPTAAGVGATNDPALAYEYGKILGEDLYNLGYRWLWSPVVDNAGVFRGTRSFGCDTETVNKLAIAFIKGVQDSGVATGAKHFPGQDPYEDRDPHFCSAAYSQSFEYWQSTQAKNFQACIDAGVDSIMIGHKTFRAVDDTFINGSLVPSTISYNVITKLLKEKMGFKGVVVSDDISMKALMAVMPKEKLYIALLNAGIDAVLGPLDLDYIDIVEKAVLNGEVSEERINDACSRILKMKEKYGFKKGEKLVAPTEESKKIICEKATEFSEKVASKGLTLTANHLNFLPLSKENIRKVKIFYIGYSEVCFNNLQYMVDEFKKYGAECEVKEGYAPSDNNTLKDYDLIIYATYIGMHAPRGGPHFYGEKCSMLWDVMTVEREKSVAVSFGDPDIYFNYFSAAPTFVNCYNLNKETMVGFVRGLYGDNQFTDFAPFPLNRITRTNEIY